MYEYQSWITRKANENRQRGVKNQQEFFSQPTAEQAAKRFAACSAVGCLVCRYMVTGVSEPSFHRKVILGSVPGYSLSHTALHRFLLKAMP